MWQDSGGVLRQGGPESSCSVLMKPGSAGDPETLAARTSNALSAVMRTEAPGPGGSIVCRPLRPVGMETHTLACTSPRPLGNLLCQDVVSREASGGGGLSRSPQHCVVCGDSAIRATLCCYSIQSTDDRVTEYRGEFCGTTRRIKQQVNRSTLPIHCVPTSEYFVNRM